MAQHGPQKHLSGDSPIGLAYVSGRPWSKSETPFEVQLLMSQHGPQMLLGGIFSYWRKGWDA